MVKVDQVLLNLQDDTLQKRNETMEWKNQMLSDNINTSYTTYIQEARAQLKQGENNTISEPDVLPNIDHEEDEISNELERMDIRSKQEKLKNDLRTSPFHIVRQCVWICFTCSRLRIAH